VPQRIPNGLVIGPESGHANTPLPDGAEPLDDDCEPPDRSFAASSALACSSACDSSISFCTCFFVATSALLLLERASASCPLLERSSPRRIACCCTRALITFASRR